MAFYTDQFVEDLFNYSSQNTHSYLILDGGQFDNLAGIVYQHDHTPTMKSLFFGTYYESVMDAGPYLVRVENNSKLLQWFIDEGIKSHAGIALKSNLGFQAVYQHLQSWLEVTLPNYNLAIFRFYDPIVCNKIMQTMSNAEKKGLIGNIEAIYWPVLTNESIEAIWQSIYTRNLL